MPFNCLKNQDPNRRKSKELEKMISAWMKNFKQAIKLLLLGAGESGKTTILKQMKILHISGFNENERLEKANEIRINILVALQELLQIMRAIQPKINLANDENQSCAQYIMQLNENENIQFNDEFYDNVDALWKDDGIQQCFAKSHEYPIIDSAKYFLDKLSEIRQNNYLPSDQDILHSRKRTTQIQKIEFSVKVPAQFGGGKQLFWMFDVGGQRGERKKWIQVFEGISAILFLVASSNFDTPIREDNETNTLIESLKLFKQIWTSKFLNDTGFILFLNKQDLLKEKIDKGISIGDYFPEFATFRLSKNDGNPNDEYTRTKCFIRDKFLEITKSQEEEEKLIYKSPTVNEPVKKRHCYYHFTTATDTNNIKHVFNDVHTMIVIANLKKTSLM